MVKTTTKIAIWVAWITIIPIGLWIIYQLFPPNVSGNELEILSFLIFMAVVASMPMVINGSPFFFLQWATLSVFLLFGLFIEILLVQVALFTVLSQVKIDKKTSFRIPLNSLMFFFVSISSASVYYLIGGTQMAEVFSNFTSFLKVLTYPVSYFIFNSLFVFFSGRFIYGRRDPFFTKDFMWEIITTVITYPVGMALYVMYKDIGFVALVLVGAPFISLSLILKLYQSTKTVNDYLKKTAMIGHQLPQNLMIKETIDTFVNQLIALFKVDFVFIHEVNEKNELQMIARVEHGKKLATFTSILKMNEGICGRVFESKELVVFHSEKEWVAINKGYMPEKIESVLSIPLIKNSKVVGVILLGSKHKKEFTRAKVMVLDLLCAQFAIAYENAKYFEKTKENSETCALTKLHNYRYFEKVLTDKFHDLSTNKINNLILIMLDIDHFKKINDQYGHQAGNEILKSFATRIKNMVGDQGLVARYGGEEFVVLLMDMEWEDAYDLAELIRTSIASTPYLIQQNIENKSGNTYVHITVSLGLASGPEHADEPLALIRHADRALYVGAKRAGRNRVASYGS